MYKVPKIEHQKRECGLCVAQTRTGTPCKRKAACKVGCKYLCWQHVTSLGGEYNAKAKECSDETRHCKKCKKIEKLKVPCRKKRTIFYTKEDYAEYCATRKARGREYPRAFRYSIIELANQEIQEQKMKAKRRVKFT
jgi:hypothetical protein